jgi:hypothetical protein
VIGTTIAVPDAGLWRTALAPSWDREAAMAHAAHIISSQLAGALQNPGPHLGAHDLVSQLFGTGQIVVSFETVLLCLCVALLLAFALCARIGVDSHAATKRRWENPLAFSYALAGAMAEPNVTLSPLQSPRTEPADSSRRAAAVLDVELPIYALAGSLAIGVVEFGVASAPADDAVEADLWNEAA